MAPSLRFTVDIKPLERFRGIINLDRSQSPIMRRMFDRIARVYSAFARRRFVQNSRGGGDWPPLSPYTISQRRKGKDGTKSAAILRDTGMLFRALSIGAVGNYLKGTKLGFIFGFGAVPHPERRSVRRVLGTKKDGTTRYGKPIEALVNGDKTFQRIAGYHEKGGGRLPRRRILVPPDEVTKKQFAGMVQRAVNEAGRAASSGLGRGGYS